MIENEESDRLTRLEFAMGRLWTGFDIRLCIIESTLKVEERLQEFTQMNGEIQLFTDGRHLHCVLSKDI